MFHGACLCGAVKFSVNTAKLGGAEACHCSLCRKWTGHYLAGFSVPRETLEIQDESQLKWYISSERARRGFCEKCGSSLFFDPLDTQKHGWIGILGGALEGSTESEMTLHIFTAEKGDYYTINKDEPQNEY